MLQVASVVVALVAVWVASVLLGEVSVAPISVETPQSLGLEALLPPKPFQERQLVPLQIHTCYQVISPMSSG
jgi:hypothetical protein